MRQKSKAAVIALLLTGPGLWASPSIGTETDGCTIKGNVSTQGERIYHVPGQRYYEKTRISAPHGERWFCSEEEARAAGWRPSKV